MLSNVLNRIPKKPLLHFVLIAATGLLVYSNTLHSPFIFDDYIFLVDNPLIKDIGYFTDRSKAEGLGLYKWVINNFNTRPVGYLTLWANYRFGGLDVEGYHTVNIALHIINAFLLYLIATLTFRTPLLENSHLKMHSYRISLIAGLLFVAHPLQTEAVTYIHQRIVLLAATFYLASLAAYIGLRLSRGRAGYGLFAIALVFAVLGMKTKENVFTLPVVIGLYEFMFFRGGVGKRVLLLVPILLTMLIIPIGQIDMSGEESMAAAFDSAIGSRYSEDMPRIHYLYTQFNVVAKYLGLFFIPAGQSLDHDQQMFQSFFDGTVILSSLLLIFIIGLGVYMVRRSRVKGNELRIVSFGVFLYFIALSVESSVLPLWELMVEYRVYLPNAGASLALGTGAIILIEGLKNKTARGIVVSSIVIMLIVLSLAAYSRNDVWKNRVSLWGDVVRKSPEKARGHINLGIAYASIGLYEEALEQGGIALKIKPDDAYNHYSLGFVYSRTGFTDKAIEHFRTAVRIAPYYANAHYNLAILYLKKGLLEEARREFYAELRIDPNHYETLQLLEHYMWKPANTDDTGIDNKQVK
jgi:tetratricopeptide (TPR) repeat protein